MAFLTLTCSTYPTTTPYRDISAASKENRTLDPLIIFKGHSSVVEDVAWHAHQSTLFASVGDDRKLLMYVALCVCVCAWLWYIGLIVARV